MQRKAHDKQSKKGGTVPSTVKTSSFSVASVSQPSASQNKGHVSVELLDEIHDALQIRAKLNDQFVLYGRIGRLPADEIKHALEQYFSGTGKLVGLYNSWPVIYSLKWKNIENPTRFYESSANCIYFFLPVVSQRGKSHKLFMKIVDSLKVGTRMLDNPLTDNINGRILYQICRDPNHGHVILNHVMQYLGSFNSLILKDADGYRSWPITDITNMQSALCPFSKNFHVEDVDGVYMTSIFDTVDGRSLSSALGMTRPVIYSVLEQFESFCTAFRLLGMKYGMMHNDLHTGNVFVDRHTNKLVIIDYGRMTFPLDVISKEDMKSIEEDEKARNFWYQNDTYDTLTQKNNRALKSNRSAEIYFTHVFDFATLMANVQFDIVESLESMSETWTWFDSYFEVKSYGDRLSASVIIPGSYDEIKTNFANSMAQVNAAQGLTDATKQGMKLLGEGLFFMSWILLYCHNKFIVTKSTPSSRAYITSVRQQTVQKSSGPIKIDISDLESHKICYYYFQFNNIDRLDLTALYNTFQNINAISDKSVIKNSQILKNLMSGRIIGGGRKKTKTTAGSPSETNNNMSPFWNDDIPLRNNAMATDDFLLAQVENDKKKIPVKHSVSRRIVARSPIAQFSTLRTPMVSALAGGKKDKPQKKSAPKKQTAKKERKNDA